MTSKNTTRVDSGTYIIHASPEKIYAALIDPAAVSKWRAPQGMTCRIFEFDARQGGQYKLALEYQQPDHEVKGKTSQHSDVVKGVFVELVPNVRTVEQVTFESPDPAFAKPMTITTTLTGRGQETMVLIAATDVPEAITPEDHAKGIESTLENLAAYVERKA